jgi:hypothetical protein
MAAVASPLKELAATVGAAHTAQLRTEFDLPGEKTLSVEVGGYETAGGWYGWLQVWEFKGDSVTRPISKPSTRPDDALREVASMYPMAVLRPDSVKVRLTRGTVTGAKVQPVAVCHHPGHGRDDRGAYQVLLEHRPGDRRGPSAGQPDPIAHDDRDARRRPAPVRGADPLRARRPGRPVSILSDKAVAIPELPEHNMVFARPGFNIIATANTRDQGVNELSAALKRRFNYVYIPIVGDQKTEVKIVQQRSEELLRRYDLPARINPQVIELLATVFREIRNGKTTDGVSLKKPSTTLSTAEAIGVALDAALHARFFGGGEVGPADIARNMVGAVVKEDQDDKAALKEYATLVAKKRGVKEKEWKEFHDALVDQL